MLALAASFAAMDICTIIAKNYVAQARVLARSFAEHHPGGRCHVLVIDDFDGYLDPGAEPFTIVTPEQIGCREFQEMALRYDILELSTAVKPWLLRHLLREGAPAITYMDPDIRIYSSLERLHELACAHGVVLIPHNTEPLPDDGKRPNQIDILLAGVYNLGYVSLATGEETDKLLGWWQQRLLNDCRVDPLNGYFVDQRWFDLAPGLVSDHAIVREPQYNTAYWNIYGRQLDYDSERYTVDGRPLAFFHFSGFDPRLPDVLSRHQSRVALNGDPALTRICSEYARDTIAAGYMEAKDWPYTYRMLPSGVEFSFRLRKLYELACERKEVEGSPFAQEGHEAFMRWLGSPAPAAPPGVNRLLADLYGTREDLQEAFPDVGGADREPLLQWAQQFGVVEEPALALLQPRGGAVMAGGATTESTRSAHDAPAAPPEAREPLLADGSAQHAPGERLPEPWGVNVVGYFRSELGVGEAARQVVSALDAQRIPLLPVHGRTIPPNRQGHPFSYLHHTQARFPVNLICMNADALGEFAAQVGSDFFRSRYSIGMWFWEVEKFPEIWISALDHVDELWLPTEHVVKAVKPVSSVPITKVTIPVDMPPVLPASRAELDLPEGFLFLFSFDHHSVFERKNPLAVIEAYTRAFQPDDGAALVVKSINAASAPDDHGRLLAAATGRPDVHILDGYLSQEKKNAMVAACDCYVSLHRAEGFGLTMAEAMYLGKPVMATGYSGNLDFMNDDNALLVEHRLVPIGPDASPYPPDGEWADPDVEHAARLMREVFDRPQLARERGRRAAEDIRRTHSPAVAGAIMGRRLDLVRERRGAMVPEPHPAHLAEPLTRRVQNGPSRGAGSRWGLPGRLVRRVLLRVLRPYTVYQQTVNAEIARAMDSLGSQTHNLDILAAERYAALLAESRDEAPRRAVWERIASLTRSTVALESATGELQQAVGELQQAVGELPEVPERLQQLDSSLKRIEWESRALPYTDGLPFVTGRHPVAGLVQGYAEGEGSSPHSYRSFEDTFRGSEDFIRECQRPYLEILDGREPVLEFGCGRGEFLDLLRDAGLSYTGVDLDAGMVARCHEKGHTQVVNANGLDYLGGLGNQSLGAIFSAQVIEHLPYEQLLRLLTLARAKLRDDGLLIAETVNPHSVPALKTFWIDLTHEQPIFPEVALALCRDAGFASAYVFHPGGSGDVERDRFTEGSYAVVANASEPVDALR
jgi:glycosyltransferase involved in cell wall biosynthesis